MKPEDASSNPTAYPNLGANMKRRRLDVRKILRDPRSRKRLFVDAGIALQAREGIETSRADMERAYDKVQLERRA